MITNLTDVLHSHSQEIPCLATYTYSVINIRYTCVVF